MLSSPCLLLAGAAAAPLSQNHGPKWEAKNAKNTLAAAAPLDDTKCVTYLALADDSSYVGSKTGVEWCEKNCPVGFCPEDRCTCVTAADAARKKAEDAGPHLSDEEKLKKLHTQLPRKVSPKISGPWFYVADGTGHEPMGAQRNELYGREVNSETVTGRKVPDWLASSKRSGNAVTLAFMDPKQLDEPGHGVPNAFVEYTALLRNGTENRDRQVYFAIGGIAFSGFHWLSNEDTAQAAGKSACEIARAHSVGIEIDHETSSGNDVEGLKSFAKGFRKQCPMGKYPLSIDLMGSPSGGGLNWMKERVCGGAHPRRLAWRSAARQRRVLRLCQPDGDRWLSGCQLPDWVLANVGRLRDAQLQACDPHLLSECHLRPEGQRHR